MASHLLLAPDTLGNSICRQNGISESTELHHRVFGAGVISQLGKALNTPRVCVCTGQALFHRFLHRVPLTQVGAWDTALACFSLACKVEEHPIQSKLILRRAIKVYKNVNPARAADAEVGSRLYMVWHERLERREMTVLKALGFNVYTIMEHPHKFILFFCQMLRSGKEDVDKALAQTAWNLLNDGMLMDLCVHFEPQTLACAAVDLAAAQLNITLPSEWWKLFSVEYDDVHAISVCLNAFYGNYATDFVDFPEALHKEDEREKPGVVAVPVVMAEVVNEGGLVIRDGSTLAVGGPTEGSIGGVPVVPGVSVIESSSLKAETTTKETTAATTQPEVVQKEVVQQPAHVSVAWRERGRRDMSRSKSRSKSRSRSRSKSKSKSRSTRHGRSRGRERRGERSSRSRRSRSRSRSRTSRRRGGDRGDRGDRERRGARRDEGRRRSRSRGGGGRQRDSRHGSSRRR